MDTIRPFGFSADTAMNNPLEVKGVTRREIQVLQWVARGKTNSEIGKILHIGPHATSKHLEHIYTKLGVGSRTAAVITYLEMSRRVRLSDHSRRRVSELSPSTHYS